MSDLYSVFCPPQPEHALQGHRGRMQYLLATYSERGLTLAQISDRKILNRKLSVLKRYCRKFQIAFPDYTPRSMKGDKK